jgi:signal transduction histidine kinase
VSHELRTPLTPIGGFADMLLLGVAGPLSADQQAYVLTIKANAQRMTALVDDLLEMGRIDAGRVELHIERIALQPTLQQVVEQLRPDIEHQQLQLTVDLPPQLPLVAADAKRVAQVVTNLLSNAVKYTHSGGQIAVRARALAGGFVEVAVTDSGIGLTPEQQVQLFTPFYRADSPLRDQVAGTGLGLCIAKSFVELHGGTISVTSAIGQGSTFSFTLPVSSPGDVS